MAFVVLVICFLFNLLGRGIGDAYVTFLLPIETQFGWSRSEISSVYSVYMLANGFSAPLIGIMFDRLGPRIVCAVGFASLGLGYLVAGNLTQLWQFHLCVGVAGGIGVTSLGMVPSQSLISRWFPTNTSTAIGIAYAGFGAQGRLDHRRPADAPDERARLGNRCAPHRCRRQGHIQRKRR